MRQLCLFSTNQSPPNSSAECNLKTLVTSLSEISFAHCCKIMLHFWNKVCFTCWNEAEIYFKYMNIKCYSIFDAVCHCDEGTCLQLSVGFRPRTLRIGFGQSHFIKNIQRFHNKNKHCKSINSSVWTNSTPALFSPVLIMSCSTFL